MFDSLEERIRHDEAEDTTTEERVMKGVLVAVLSTVLFGGLYFAVRHSRLSCAGRRPSRARSAHDT